MYRLVRTFAVLVCLFAGLQPESAYAQVEVVYKEGLALDVYAAKKGSPVLLYIHGGGWYFGDKRQHDAPVVSVDLAARGFTVITVNYTLVPSGYYPRQLQDIDCALRWVAENAMAWGFDASNISIGGSSAGGHLALLYSLNQGAYRDPTCPYTAASPAVRRVISISGPTDLSRAPTQELHTIVANFLTGSNAYREASPLTYADSPNVTHYLIIQAMDDEVTVTNTQIIPFYSRLLAWNPVTVSGKWYDSGGHGLLGHYQDVVGTMAAFLSDENVSTPPLNVSCGPSLGSLYQVGQGVTWVATTVGGTGVYAYSWAGTDGLFGTGQTTVAWYSSTGEKSASVTVTSGIETKTVTCTDKVTVIPVPSNAPAATTLAAAKSVSNVVVNGVANTNGAPLGIAWFRYGPSGSSLACSSLPYTTGFVMIGAGDVSVSLATPELVAGVAYDFCIVVGTSSGIVHGDVLSFTYP